jgi:UDP-N-acetylenolpyruvoylglucosamine reductase
VSGTVYVLIAVLVTWMLACAHCGYVRRPGRFVVVLLVGLLLNLGWMVWGLRADPFEVNVMIAQAAALVYGLCAGCIGWFAGRMNAGCYGSYTADHFVSAQVVLRDGRLVTLGPDDLNFRYRQSDLAEGAVLVSASFAPPQGQPEVLHQRMEEQLRKRDETQPTKDRSAGSTFRNPAGFSSTGRADDVHDLKAWKVIDDAGMRGATRGGAQMSPMHSNFLINTGDATAADLEGLGEEVRKKVYDTLGITLEWEIMRLGDPLDPLGVEAKPENGKDQ